MKKFWIPFIGLLWLLISCQPTDIVHAPPITPEPKATSQPALVVKATPQPEVDSVDSLPEADTVPKNLIDRAKEELAARLGVDLSYIEVVNARQVDWPDASLGCPEPEMVYAQVITPGYKITLEANTKLYIYHTDNKEQVIFCAREMTLPVIPGEIQDGIPWVPVD